MSRGSPLSVVAGAVAREKCARHRVGLANRFSRPFRVYDCRIFNYSVSYSGATRNSSVVASSKRKTKALALPSLGLN